MKEIDKVISDLRVLSNWITEKPGELATSLLFDDVQDVGRGKLNWSLDELMSEAIGYLSGEKLVNDSEIPDFVRKTPLTDAELKSAKAFSMWIPKVPLRGPSPAERHELAKCVTKRNSKKPTLADLEEVEEQLSGAYIAVFPHYMTGSPGYVGKVYVIVWDGAPEFYDAFIEGKNGQLKYIVSETSKGYGENAELMKDINSYQKIVAQDNKLIDDIVEVLSDPAMLDECAVYINDLIEKYNKTEVK